MCHSERCRNEHRTHYKALQCHMCLVLNDKPFRSSPVIRRYDDHGIYQATMPGSLYDFLFILVVTMAVSRHIGDVRLIGLKGVLATLTDRFYTSGMSFLLVFYSNNGTKKDRFLVRAWNRQTDRQTDK